MAGRTSAGILLYRLRDGVPEVLLVHPGGPFWKNRDAGSWSIPKGEIGEGEDPLHTALREFREETGHDPPPGRPVPLPPVRLKSGKLVLVWALEGDLDPDTIHSNTFEMEWPPHSGRIRSFPEIDRASWFPLEEAARRANPAYAPLFDALKKMKGLE